MARTDLLKTEPGDTSPDLMTLLENVIAELVTKGECTHLAMPAVYMEGTDVPTHWRRASGCLRDTGFAFEALVLPLDAEMNPAMLTAYPDSAISELEIVVAEITFPGEAHFALCPVALPRGRWDIHRSESLLLVSERDGAKAEQAYAPILKRLSQITGKTVVLDTNGRGVRQPARPRSPQITIYANAVPPGALQKRQDVSTLFELPLTSSGTPVDVRTPTLGRGRTINDPEGRAAAQVLGDTWYLMFPVFTYFHGNVSADLLQRTIEEILLCDANDPPCCTEGEFRETVTAMLGRTDFDLESERLVLELQIDQAQKHLSALLLRQRMMLSSHRAWFERKKLGTYPFERELEERADADFASITSDPRFVAWRVIDRAVQVTTRNVVTEHDGRRHACGQYTMRLDQSGQLTVWSEGPTHPRGVPHPHMAPEGGACFGNATHAILQAASELRYAKTFGLTFRWLEEGYEPDTTLHPIDEWPLADADGNPIPEEDHG